MRCEKFIYDTNAYRARRKEDSYNRNSEDPGALIQRSKSLRKKGVFSKFSSFRSPTIQVSRKIRNNYISPRSATSNGKKYTRHLRTTIDFGTKIQCCSTLELDFKTTFQLDFFFVVPPSRYFLLFKLPLLFCGKAKGRRGRARNCVSSSTPRGGGPCQSKKKKGREGFNRGSGLAHDILRSFHSMSD